jgi:Ca2+-dependent lipid-binding protein
MFNFKKGTLQVEILSANLSRDTEILGKMDPYATFEWDTLNKKEGKYKTKVC